MTMTARQIAEKLGISNATVSRVLNNSSSVSAETREAVLNIVSENGKLPRVLGPRNKRSESPAACAGKQMMILYFQRFQPTRIDGDPDSDGPLVHTPLPNNKFFAPEARLTTAFFRHIMDGVIEELRLFDVRSMVQLSDKLLNRKLINEINRRDNRGVFLFGIYTNDVPEFLDQCQCPVVSFMTWAHNGWPDYVGIDNYTGTRLAFEHVRALGHTRIAYVAGELEYVPVLSERLNAFKSLHAGADLPYRPDWIFQGSCHIGPVQAQVEAILRQPDRPTAILCGFDTAAVAVQRAAHRLGLSIPGDLSIVGYNDEDIAQLVTPPLTTVRVPTVHMGRQAVQLMMMRQQHPIRRGEGCSIRVTPTLVTRHSTAAPPANMR